MKKQMIYALGAASLMMLSIAAYPALRQPAPPTAATPTQNGVAVLAGDWQSVMLKSTKPPAALRRPKKV